VVSESSATHRSAARAAVPGSTIDPKGEFYDVPSLCRAYNRWLADYCKPYPDRLFGAAMLPLQSVELAITEMRYARKELGMRSGFVRPDPYLHRSLDHADYEPFWAEAQDRLVEA
jgi:predicted TIM-barrel fold metal-dependent hydrolase